MHAYDNPLKAELPSDSRSVGVPKDALIRGNSIELPWGIAATMAGTAATAANYPEDGRFHVQQSCTGASIWPGRDGDLWFEPQPDSSDGVVIQQLSTTAEIRLRFPEQYDAYLLAALDVGAVELEICRTWQQRRGPGAVMAETMHVSRWRWHPGRYELLVVDAARLQGRLAQLLERPLVRRLEFELDAPGNASGIRIVREMARVARMCMAREASMHWSPETLRNLQDAMMSSILETIPHNYSAYLARRHAGPSPRQVRRAMDFIHANATSAIRLEDIAKAARVSIRALQSGFAKFKGITPIAYLKQVRLEGVHAALCVADDDQSIAEIARHWRFGHMGQFARDYRKAFGQAPSKTRRTGETHNRGPQAPAPEAIS